MTVIMMWAHSRSASTAFLRMMIERGDVYVVHEPFLALSQEGVVAVPRTDASGSETHPTKPRESASPDLALSRGPRDMLELLVRSEKELLAHLADLARSRPVFVKEVLDLRYDYLFEHPEELAGITHTFIVRDPKQTISSHYAVKPTVTCPEIGYERLFELFELVRSAAGREPLVLRAERLVREPAQVVEAFCAYTGLPFLPGALTWDAGDRPEWHRHRAWHLDAINSAGFEARANTYPDTVDNNATLKSFYDHHLPFYERLVQHAF